MGAERRTHHPFLLAISKPAEYETGVQRVDDSVFVDVGGVAEGVAGVDGAAEAGEDVAGIERIDHVVGVGVAGAGRFFAFVGDAIAILVRSETKAKITFIGTPIGITIQ